MTRVAVVTGAARGIGAAIARVLGERGWTVAVCDRDGEQAADVARQVDGSSVAFDLEDSAAVLSGAAEIASRFPTVDALVNNAGWESVMPFGATDVAFRERLVRVNLLGPMMLTHALLPALCAAGGRIVNISSDAGRVGSKGEVVYSATKAAILGFTRALAREVADSGVTVNAVVPGPTDTPLYREGMREHPDLVERMARAIPLGRALGRIGRPEDVANVVAFLLSPEAEWITGETIAVNGGFVIA